MSSFVRFIPLTWPFIIIFFFFLFLLSRALAAESDHKGPTAAIRQFVSNSNLSCLPTLHYNYFQYQPGESVVLWVNKVGPYNNPQETYNYYSLPFCHPSGDSAHKWGGLGEVLGGNELIDSRVEIKFLKNMDRTTICPLHLDEAKVKLFKNAIQRSYWLELFIGTICIMFYSFVGELPSDKNSEDEKHILYTHKNIIIKYNKDQIIHVNLTQESPKSLEVGRSLDMTYSVKWIPTNVTFARRFDIYLDYPFFEHQIHWFSIFNSFMMVIFLTGLVSMILMRTLRNDYAKYAREDDDLETLERDVSEESGWKLVHGDVFRSPRCLVILSAVVGTGAQLAVLVLLVILLAIIGMLYVGRGAIITTFIVCYALTSSLSGYVSGGMYSRHGGKSWIKSMILTASLFPFMCFGIGLVLNTIAIFYGSLAAIPFGTMVVVFVIWAFIYFPLALLGTVVGRNWSGTPNNPCRVKTIPRPVPEKKWYLTPSVVSLMGGLLPFGSIFIEMYFVFTSFWNYKQVYYVYGFMLLVFLILIIVTICVTIVGTYFLLNAENYHWQWTSFFSAASTAVYLFLYSIYYFYVKTRMSGFFQTSFYFGYTLMFCLGLGILCGAVGYLGSNLFVRMIYRNIKCD
ncbi:Transmembrane 9 superfamily member 1, partial [Cucurbita argyrosperma subsp. argyrosperma]